MNFFVENKEWFVGIIASVAMFFGGRKSKKQNEKSAELENLKTIRDMEKQLVEDVKHQISELRQINEGLQMLIDQKDEIIDQQQDVIDQQQDLINQQKEAVKEQISFVDKYVKQFGKIKN